MHVNTWLKWRLIDSPDVTAIVDAVLSGADSPNTTFADPLAAALAGLAAEDTAGVLSAVGPAPATAPLATVLGDALAMRGDWPGARAAYQRAVSLADADPVARIGRAVAATDAQAALVDLRPLHTERPDDQVIAHYFAAALVRRAGEVCARSRDDRLVITSPAQLDECERIRGELHGVRVGDPDLARDVDALIEQVTNGRTWTWREYGGNAGVLALVLLASVGFVVLGGIIADIWLVIGAALVGAGAVFLYVVNNRRPAWELRAQDLANMITSPGA